MSDDTNPSLSAPRDLAGEVHEMNRRLMRIELILAKQDGQALHERIEGLVADVRALQVWRGWLVGGLAVAGSGLAAIVVKLLMAEP